MQNVNTLYVIGIIVGIGVQLFGFIKLSFKIGSVFQQLCGKIDYVALDVKRINGNTGKLFERTDEHAEKLARLDERQSNTERNITILQGEV